ncbi:MAG: hypothetical protein M5R40_26295 [Anaerolineae bacterium]|nr:hypothetical protein [Anaerolineae bacterium]
MDDAGLDITDLGQPGSAEEAGFEAVRACVAEVLGARVVEVRASKTLTDSPARLVSPQDAPGRNVQRVYRLLERDNEVPKKIMELNPRHTLIRNLAGMLSAAPDAPLINAVIEQLYESALLVDGLHPDPASKAPRIQALMESDDGERRAAA